MTVTTGPRPADPPPLQDRPPGPEEVAVVDDRAPGGTDAGATARRILDLLFRHARLADPTVRCAQTPCQECYATYLPKVQRQVEAGEPVTFTLPAFPAKSPNPLKVVGTLPDLAEELSLSFLQSVCETISYYHPPGARVVICSDGHVFGDLVSVSDETISRYRHRLIDVISGCDRLDLFCLEDVYSGAAETMRHQMELDYAVGVDQVRESVAADDRWKAVFNGLHRFIFEDRCALSPTSSRSSLRKSAKALAYGTLNRSNAWGELVAERFPEATRLSIHPQQPHSPKLGIKLLRAADPWLTPWHGVAVDDGRTITLTTRDRAEALGGRLIVRDGLPSHYVAPHLDLLEESA